MSFQRLDPKWPFRSTISPPSIIIMLIHIFNAIRYQPTDDYLFHYYCRWQHWVPLPFCVCSKESVNWINKSKWFIYWTDRLLWRQQRRRRCRQSVLYTQTHNLECLIVHVASLVRHCQYWPKNGNFHRRSVFDIFVWASVSVHLFSFSRVQTKFPRKHTNTSNGFSVQFIVVAWWIDDNSPMCRMYIYVPIAHCSCRCASNQTHNFQM